MLTTDLYAQEQTAEDSIQYYGKDHFLIEGSCVDESLKSNPYHRLPDSYKEKVREPVWELSKSSAGITVRFMSNSSSISAKWTVLNDADMPHMAETGIKGLDLYYKHQGKWQYVNTAKPSGKENEALLVEHMSSEMQAYKMFLPLYDGLEKLEIGIDAGSVIQKPEPLTQKPIIFYGTSITQGGCASRPGMAHTSIISRKLDTEVVNFGFSGNGKMEVPIAELIAQTDARFYVIDCLPNMKPDKVSARTIPLVEIIRKHQPETPIVLVENLIYEGAYLNQELNDLLQRKNAALKEEYEKLQEKGIKHIYYVSQEGALRDDHEATVDGVHFTDLGFLRFADHLLTNFETFGLLDE
ncbi:SGNH/GDSL hydrolase family protein [Catalinimonas alkaloidigena]|uniref:SGNH/GDSL hydrolase family protein n=1 Tax=Catalinimonas alkaloidigena TaxID=1075417 RepID=UPI002406A621|nr:SGNH/GDSL hydrolase family protein [Catalinimonas alkaloidigena]